MTDDLIARLRNAYVTASPEEAADALEAQARRIAELEAQWSQDVLFENCEYRSEAGWDRLRARIAELEATIRKFQLVEKALNYFLEKDTPHTWRYRREEAEELARADLEKKND